MKRLTTFRITSAMHEVEDYIVQELGMTKAAFHRKAYEAFLAGNQEIDPSLYITKYTDKNYIKRSYVEQTALSDELKEQLKEVADQKGVLFSAVLFQALYDYCLAESEKIGTEKILEKFPE